MATIRETLLYAPYEAEEFFLARCDEGLHAGACDWLRVEVEPLLEAELDYAGLRARARMEASGEHPVAQISNQRARERSAPTRDCWYCGECLSTDRVNCPVCGRNQQEAR